MTIQAVFENGVFRPTEPVSLPERTRVEFDPKVIGEEMNGEQEQALQAVYELLSRSYNTGQTDAAARHN